MPEKNNALTELAEKFGTKETYGFSQDDEDRALRIAKFIWDIKDEKEKEIIKKYTKNVFELWKIEHGMPPNHLFGTIVREDYTIEENECLRLSRIKKLKPWECSPLWIEKNPLDFLLYLWSNSFWELPNTPIYFALSHLIIECSKSEIKKYRAAMVKHGFWLSEIIRDITEESSKNLFSEYKKAVRKNLNFTLHNRQKVEKAAIRNIEIRTYASKLLDKGIEGKHIVGIIAKSMMTTEKKTNIEALKRRVRRALEGHDSNIWCKKRKSDTR